jgi:hypothetical protein
MCGVLFSRVNGLILPHDPAVTRCYRQILRCIEQATSSTGLLVVGRKQTLQGKEMLLVRAF